MFIISKKIFLILFSSLILTGCYTVIWQPSEELPNKENTVKRDIEYYNLQNFGVFGPYYNSPWWINPDNDFLIDSFNGLTDINDDAVDAIYINDVTREKVLGIINPVILVAPAGKILTNKAKVRKTVLPKIKTTHRNKTKSNSSIRNNNGRRKNKNGRNR